MTQQVLKVLILACLVTVSGCKHENPGSVPTTRTYRMGFQNSAPRTGDFDLVLQTLGIWTTRADAAMITTEVPWDSLLQGKNAAQYVLNNYKGLVDYYRQKNFKLWVYIDPQNGLNRASDANALVVLGKSIAQEEMREIYRRFVVAMDSILRPEHLGLALETNLIRLLSTPAIYEGVKQAAHDAAEDVRMIDSSVRLSISVQAETAWGKLGGNGQYAGVDQDFNDFQFSEELGISSYPYFVFDNPKDLPSNYYSKLVETKLLPVFISEGGWTSQTFIDANNKTITSSPDIQRAYIERQGELLDNAHAIGVFQLSFTDIDLSDLPAGVDPSIKYFAYLGMVDVDLQPRPALTTWDQIFARSGKE